MRIKRKLPVILALIFLISSIIFVSGVKKPIEQKQPSTSCEALPQGEMRGIWVSYMTLDVEDEDDPEKAFKDKIDLIIKEMITGGYNTMVVQVRPFSDALYPSKYYPWSHILTGTQGKDPGYDPLAYIIKSCHQNNIAVHAWVNPYRVSTAETPSELSDNNPFIKDEKIGVTIDGKRYLNPASKKAMKLIADGVSEIVENYDVDGIQFDDYFYPENCRDFDNETYQAYQKNASSPLSLEEYRKENVNTLIRMVYRAVHQSGKNIMFGISPQGNLDNNDDLYADVKKWCHDDGYIDYICPQIYFSLDNPAKGFEEALNEWIKLNKRDNLKIYIGLAGYKAGTDADSGTWLDNSEILMTEAQIVRENGLDGFMLFSCESFWDEKNRKEIKTLTNYLTTPTQQSSSASTSKTS